MDGPVQVGHSAIPVLAVNPAGLGQVAYARHSANRTSSQHTTGFGVNLARLDELRRAALFVSAVTVLSLSGSTATICDGFVGAPLA